MPLLAQPQLDVKSFNILANDLSARIDAPLKDQNGEICAIIKVVTTQTGFSFECGQLGVIKTIQKPSEIWVYVPRGAKRLTIAHPHLGILRDYTLPLPVEKATVYELVLISGSVEVVVAEKIVSQFLVITTEPADAMVFLDDKFVIQGIYQSKLKPGTYSYRVEAPMYQTEAGKFEIKDTTKELHVVLKLKPAYGYISVISEPENNAKVLIDGQIQSKTTPIQNEPIASGEHIVQVVKEMYQPEVKKITVTDGQTTNVNLRMNPTFAELKINVPAGAEVFIQNQSKGIGSWQGRLNAGVYSLEARLEKHRTAKKDIDLIAGNIETIELNPYPIYGSMDVITNPPGAIITIKGKEFGKTPKTIGDLLIGEYEIGLNKLGYNSIKRQVTIADGKTTKLNEILKFSSQSNLPGVEKDSSRHQYMNDYSKSLLSGKTGI
jgi:hypothetical protein